MLENLLEVFKFRRILQKDAVQKTLGNCSLRSVFYRTISTTAAYRKIGWQLYIHSEEISKNDWGALVELQPVDVSRWL